jgi:hypothetical protein
MTGKDALASIEAGDLSGTQYTDVRQQGRFAASAAIVMATAEISAKSAGSNKGHLLMPYTIATRESVGSIKPEQRAGRAMRTGLRRPRASTLALAGFFLAVVAVFSVLSPIFRSTENGS